MGAVKRQCGDSGRRQAEGGGREGTLSSTRLGFGTMYSLVPQERGGQDSCCLSKWVREGWGTEIRRWAPEPDSAEVASRGGAGTQGTFQLREL